MMRLKNMLYTLAFTVAFQAHAAEKKPNFLVIVADDLGYSDIGAFGGEIDTPNLDAIASSGLKLTGFHTAPTCSPTRSMLLSGTDNHRAGLGTMAELISPNQKGQPGHEGYLRPEVAALPELLVSGGYRTILSGKWHLGLTAQQDPHARGFQHSFALLQGGHNHFGNNSGPSTATYTQDGKPVAKLPDDFYSSDYFATKLIEQLKASGKGAEGKKPFFAYLAFTAPHWPLQAPRADIAKYKGRYDAGFDVLRAQRLKRQAELGLIDPAKAAHIPALRSGGWDSLSAEDKRVAARDMEIYAAMVDRLDKNVGRVIDALKRSGEYDNTVILFLADNGAEGLDVARTEMVGINKAAAAADNSFDNLGAATSYVSYGPGWAQAATAPSWLYKAYATEGGTRAVSFISYKGFERKGVNGAFLSVADVSPTFLELAGVADPKGSFQGRSVEPIRGKSWVSYLSGKADRVYAPNDSFGTELFGSRALRQGDWKITDIGDGKWRLFNIAEDPGETNDLSLEQPDRRKDLIAAWDVYAKDVGVIIPDQRIYQP
ncbi:arylsulfatase [Sphingobium phenoxybenzoativorans]|uniref:arylsulfatase n=1 Tax=Sphingobium phenoxybenzoativorans TaxID=1592790 RepID=UPI00209B638A|nr:arylsulfatase [Sphingobium phenoxybenzoativorans]